VTPERLREIELLFHEARERTSPERDVLLTRACANDSALRREVESLLAQPPTGIIDMPVGAFVTGLVTPASPLLIGRRIGVFEVQELLGVGGMGEVYRARRPAAGPRRRHQNPAARVQGQPRPAGPLRTRRRDARLAQSPAHRHHLRAGGSRRPHSLVMELVDGEDLSQGIARGPSPSPKRYRSPGRSPTLSKPPTSRASSTAISNPRTSRCGPTAA